MLQATGIATERIDAYWNERSTTYSASVRNELGTSVKRAWHDVLADAIPGFGTERLRVLDIGCGPGFFGILCAEAGCTVDAIDFSAGMLEKARMNAQASEVETRIRFRQGDAQRLPYESGSFDAIVTRNVTWNLEDPYAAYREWHRVLKPGGRMVNFDANWYTYLVDDEQNLQRQIDQLDPETLGAPRSERATDEQCDRCERIARALPLTRCERPAWDMRALRNAGFAHAFADTSVHKRVWTPGEEAFYASSPLFMVVGVK